MPPCGYLMPRVQDNADMHGTLTTEEFLCDIDRKCIPYISRLNGMWTGLLRFVASQDMSKIPFAQVLQAKFGTHPAAELASTMWNYIQVLCIILVLTLCQGDSSFTSMRSYLPKVSNIDTKNWAMGDNTTSVFTHPCKRTCRPNDPMTCYYYLVVHYDETMGPSCGHYLNKMYSFANGGSSYINALSIRNANADFDDCKYGDGTKLRLMLVNRQWPGQPIEVCYGDTIVADVINSMHEATTIHWHGLHQLKTPYMDGVGHITQYPIDPGQAFRYSFEVDHTGTHWWHSHTGHQRGFGLAGALIVREPSKTNGHANLYDYDKTEHIIMVQDWLDNYEERVADNILINGLGRNMREKYSKQPTFYATFNVVRGARYRFRVIFNGISNCPISLSIDQHDLLVIASDGNDIEPIKVQQIVFTGGERFDFVLNAGQNVDRYWLRIKGYNFCVNKQLYQEAIIHYEGADSKSLPKGKPSYEYETNGLELNSIDVQPGVYPNRITLVETNAFGSRNEPPVRIEPPQYISMTANTRTNFIFQMDDITFTMPKISLLQARNLGINRFICNRTQMTDMGWDCRTQHCKCTNVIQVPAYKNIELVISSTGDFAHPIHLHGFTFKVVGMGVLGADRIRMIEEIDRKTPLPRRSRGAPLKDTVQVPAFGYTIIRFYSNNPGYWSFHCHVSTHAENGMAAIIRVGDNDQMKMCPVSNCGLCSSML